MHDLPHPLRAALDAAVLGTPGAELAATTARLVDRYREGSPADAPLLVSDVDAVAYATYRMPATYVAVRSALAELVQVAPELAPRTHLDVGGGTGAAVWAAADAWPTITTHTVVEQVPAVVELGRSLVAAGPATTWITGDVTTASTADVVTVSYLLGELDPGDRERLLDGLLAHRPPALVLVEPGTVAGHERILAARAQVLAAGMHLAAPCPHAEPCPMVGTRDWCHMAARVQRSAAHRRAKGADKSFEDEKFAYLVAVREPVVPAEGRVVRHPTTRKGLVDLQLCATPPGLVRTAVSKRQGPLYKAARDTAWGDPWPPPR